MSEIIRIPHIENYNMEFINGELILTPKKQYISEKNLLNTNLNYSKIQKCIIKKNKEIISTRDKYSSILKDIWKCMSIPKILKTTTFNIKLTNEAKKNGYNWCDDIQLSFQSKDSCGTLREIINMIKINNFTIDLVIQLKLNSNSIIYFKN